MTSNPMNILYLLLAMFVTGLTIKVFEKFQDSLADLFFEKFKLVFILAPRLAAKYSIQVKINKYITKLNQTVPNLDATKVSIEWIDKDTNQEQFLKSNTLVVRMRRHSDKNNNAITAIYTFVSHQVVTKIKTYLQECQKQAIDLFVTSKVIEGSSYEVVRCFTNEFLREGLAKESVDQLYNKFEIIYKAGLFFPILINELTFMGDKIFAKGISRKRIFEEVDGLINFLLSISARQLCQKTQLEHNGTILKFAIRIVGKKNVIQDCGERVYVNSIVNQAEQNETIYLLGDSKNTSFIESVSKRIIKQTNYFLFHKLSKKAILHIDEKQDKEVISCIYVLRNNSIKTIIRN